MKRAAPSFLRPLTIPPVTRGLIFVLAKANSIYACSQFAAMTQQSSGTIQPEFSPRLEECPLCRSDALSLSKIDFNGIRIDRCRDCGVEFMNPQYTDHYLQDFYDQYQSDLAKQHHFGEDLKPRELIHTYNLAQIESFRKPGRFLSVGCGKGVDLQVAAARGWKAEGYDVDPEYVKTQSEAIGIPIRSGIFPELDYEENSFDCVYLNHVLEHPKNPGDYLEKIIVLLKPGGILYIACPNIGSPSGRIKNLLDALHLRKTRAKHYDTWQHLFYFTPAKLSRVLERIYGFEILYQGSDVKARRGDEEVRTAPFAALCLKSTFRLIARLRQE